MGWSMFGVNLARTSKVSAYPCDSEAWRWGCMRAKGFGVMISEMPVDLPKYWLTRWLPSFWRLEGGIFQHENDQEHTAKIMQEFLKKKKNQNYDLATYVAWNESYRTLLGYFKEKGKASQPLKQRAAENNVSEEWQNISQTCRERVCHQKQRWTYEALQKQNILNSVMKGLLTFVALSSYCGACICNVVNLNY